MKKTYLIPLFLLIACGGKKDPSQEEKQNPNVNKAISIVTPKDAEKKIKKLEGELEKFGLKFMEYTKNTTQHAALQAGLSFESKTFLDFIKGKNFISDYPKLQEKLKEYLQQTTNLKALTEKNSAAKMTLAYLDHYFTENDLQAPLQKIWSVIAELEKLKFAFHLAPLQLDLVRLGKEMKELDKKSHQEAFAKAFEKEIQKDQKALEKLLTTQAQLASPMTILKDQASAVLADENHLLKEEDLITRAFLLYAHLVIHKISLPENLDNAVEVADPLNDNIVSEQGTVPAEGDDELKTFTQVNLNICEPGIVGCLTIITTQNGKEFSLDITDSSEDLLKLVEKNPGETLVLTSISGYIKEGDQNIWSTLDWFEVTTFEK